MNTQHRTTGRMILLLAVLAALVWGPAVRRASSESPSGTFRYLAGSDFLCGFFSAACPDVAMAENGDTIEIKGSGALSIYPKSVTGSGTFKHKDATGTVVESGTWTAQELVSFVPYVVLPNTAAGGEALIRVHLSSGFDAILTITCDIGAPPGHTEGVRVNIQNMINFSKKVSGITLYLAQ
jgi:hypothetical protein